LRSHWAADGRLSEVLKTRSGMIRASLAGLAGAWIARDAERGDIPEGLAVPLTLLAARLPAAALIVGAIGYGLYRLNNEARARRAKDVTPKSRAKPRNRKQAPKPRSR